MAPATDVTPFLSPARLATIVASRFVLNAMFRVAYPLIPFIAGHFAISVEVATWIVTLQVLSGLLSPVGGWLGDRIGFRAMMLTGFGLALLGALGATVAPSFALLVMAFAIFGVGVALYQPSMQAYVAVLTPYQQRGRAFGMVELSWALAGIAAVPLLAWLVERQGELAIAFGLVAASIAVMGLLTFLLLPPEPRQPRVATQARPHMAIWSPSVCGMLGFIVLAMGGTELMYIAQPAWATEQFRATLLDLGTASLVYGVGELLGATGSTLLTDRLGKRRAALLGFSMTALAFVALPMIGVSWPLYLLMYFLLGVCVEFAIVASLTLASTVAVIGRATVMALVIAIMQVGRALASRLGVPLLTLASLHGNAAVAAALTLFGVLIAWRFVRESEATSNGS
jgi:DHA1 family inner membrane transport protein